MPWEGGGLCREGGGDAHSERGMRKKAEKSFPGVHRSTDDSVSKAHKSCPDLETMETRGWKQWRECWGTGETRRASSA